MQKCVELAEAAGHDNVIICGDFCQTDGDWKKALRRAEAESTSKKSYLYTVTGHDLIVAYPQRLVVATTAFELQETKLKWAEKGRHTAYYMRIAWELEAPEPLP